MDQPLQPSRSYRGKSLLYLVESPLSQRDIERFGVELLATCAHVGVLDVTPLVKPNVWRRYEAISEQRPYNIPITKLSGFIGELIKYRRATYIDFLGFGIIQSLARLTAKILGLRRVVIDVGNHPDISVGKSRFRCIKSLIFSGRRIFPSVIYKVVNAVCRPHFGIAAGTVISSKVRAAKQIIQIHSLDYDTYLSTNGKRHSADDHPGIVFLHQAPEYSSDGTSRDMAEEYCKEMAKLLKKLEDHTQLQVTVALHPRARAHHTACFSMFSVAVGETARLIRSAKLVVNHCSTAVSYAVLWRRPILHVTYKSFKLYSGNIERLADLLNTACVDLDDQEIELPRLDDLFKVDESAYLDYQHKYIKAPNGKDGPFWMEFLSLVLAHDRDVATN